MNNPLKFLHTIIFTSLLSVSTIILGTISVPLSLINPKIGRYITDICWGRCVLILGGLKIKSLGLEKLPQTEGSYIFYANHSSAADIPVLSIGTGKLVSWLAKASLGKIPFFGWGLARVHMLVDRGGGPQAAKKMVAEARARLDDNQILAIFPEGTRNRSDDLLLPFKKGAFILSKQTGAPIIPVAIKNAGKLWPAGSLCPKPGLIRLKVGDPLTPLEGERLGELTKRAQDALYELLSDQSW